MLEVVTDAVLVMLIFALVLSFFRLVKGPSQPDRLAALNLVSTLATGFIGVYAIKVHQLVLLDVAIVLAVISFLGVLVLAYYVKVRESSR
jgi:multicomponent Na+:H+ antiporter subunit F